VAALPTPLTRSEQERLAADISSLPPADQGRLSRKLVRDGLLSSPPGGREAVLVLDALPVDVQRALKHTVAVRLSMGSAPTAGTAGT
jgi:hypothetical protein